MGKVVELKPNDPIWGVYQAIEQLKKQGKSDSWIEARIVGCLPHYNLFEAIQKTTGDCKEMTILEIIKEVGDY